MDTQRTIVVNGVVYPVRAARRQSPKAPPHAYVLEGATVYQVGAEWRIQPDGEWPVSATVDQGVQS